MSKLNVYTDPDEKGNMSCVSIHFDERNEVNICTGDHEIWIDVTTVDGQKYVFEFDDERTKEGS